MAKMNWDRRFSGGISGGSGEKCRSTANDVELAFEMDLIEEADKAIMQEAEQRLRHGTPMTPQQAGKWGKYKKLLPDY